MFCNIKHFFIVTFDQFNASLRKCFFFLLTDPKLNGNVFSEIPLNHLLSAKAVSSTQTWVIMPPWSRASGTVGPNASFSVTMMPVIWKNCSAAQIHSHPKLWLLRLFIQWMVSRRSYHITDSKEIVSLYGNIGLGAGNSMVMGLIPRE